MPKSPLYTCCVLTCCLLQQQKSHMWAPINHTAWTLYQFSAALLALAFYLLCWHRASPLPSVPLAHIFKGHEGQE